MTRAAALRMLLGACLAAAVAPGAYTATGTASGGAPAGNLNASASLDFVLNIGRFIYFRVGPSAYPATSPDPATLDITMQPIIPGAPTVPTVSGNNVPLVWDGGVPTFAPVPAITGIPVQVRTNAGQISIRANVISPLVSGANSIALSQILVTSTDAGLPAPTIPDSGTGPSVTVSGTAFSNLVAIRSANWNFTYTPAVLPPQGTYTGQISFTAVSP